MVTAGTITADRLLLEPLRSDHAMEMANVLSAASLYVFIGGEPPTTAELAGRYAAWLSGPARGGEAWLNWIIRDRSGSAVGHAQATVTRDGAAADVAWVVGEAWQGRGYATEAARALVSWLEDEGVETITAHVHPDHLASARVAERAGLERTDLEEDGEVVWRRTVSRR
jgi:RimJ/RimL family protein N-acetyltransferase